MTIPGPTPDLTSVLRKLRRGVPVSATVPEEAVDRLNVLTKLTGQSLSAVVCALLLPALFPTGRYFDSTLALVFDEPDFVRLLLGKLAEDSAHAGWSSAARGGEVQVQTEMITLAGLEVCGRVKVRPGPGCPKVPPVKFSAVVHLDRTVDLMFDDGVAGGGSARPTAGERDQCQ